MSDERTAFSIHTALIGAMRDICKLGIGKTKRADAGVAKYNYRGIDDAMNEMSPILVNNGITVTPRYSDLVIQEREKDGGKFSRFVTIKGAFTFGAADGSSVTAEAYGEAMDSGDKATIKAQSVAYRTVLFQQFIVPLMAMDTELDENGTSADDAMLSEFREAALNGTKALQKHFENVKPPAVFWSRNSASLKAAATEADKAAS
jgi:ERF superfamily